MKNIIFFLAVIISSTPVFGQFETIELEFETIRPLSELNTIDEGEGYPWISNDGLRIYYTQGPGTESKIMYSHRDHIDSLFSEPTSLSINSDDIGHTSQWLGEDELNVYYFRRSGNGGQSTTLYHASREDVDQEFGEPVKINLLGGVQGYSFGPSFTNDLEQLYVYNSFAGRSILILEKSGENEYTLMDKMDIPPLFNTGPGQISPDGLKFYIGLVSQIDFEKTIFIAERESIEDKFETFFFIDNALLNPSDFSNIHPSSSNDGNFLAFARNVTGTWEGNNLYIAQNRLVSVLDDKFDKRNVKIAPNPATDFISFSLENFDCANSELDVTIYTYEGRLIEKRTLPKTNSKFNLSTIDYDSGTYFYKLTCSNRDNIMGSFVVQNH